MKSAKIALVTALSMSLAAAFAANRKPSHGGGGGNHSKPTSHSKPSHSKPSNNKPSHSKPTQHKPNKPHKPVHHSGSNGCKAGDYSWGGGCHSYPKPVKPVNTTYHNHYGHAYSSYYTTSYPYYYNGYYYGSPWWHSQPIHTTPVVVGPTVDVTCSPETLNKNTFAAEAVLVGLAQNELKDSSVFTQKVADFQEMSGAQKVDEGMRIAGVKNPKDAKEVLALIYAREPSAESVARVSDNLNLTNEEAKLVVVSVSQALKQR